VANESDLRNPPATPDKLLNRVRRLKFEKAFSTTQKTPPDEVALRKALFVSLPPRPLRKFPFDPPSLIGVPDKEFSLEEHIKAGRITEREAKLLDDSQKMLIFTSKAHEYFSLHPDTSVMKYLDSCNA
jgi:hypothetical protein